MSRIGRITLLFGCFIFILLSSPVLFAAVGMTLTSYLDAEYHRFYVADLGLTGGSSSRTLFTLTFGSNPLNATEHSLHIEVTNGEGDLLLSGNTDSWPYNEKFSGQTYTNYNVADDANLGGTFDLKGEAEGLKDAVLATGAFPAGTVQINIQLVDDSLSSVVDGETVIIRIVPPYLQPIYPLSISVSEASCDFRWRSNLHDLEFHLYEDPRGQREVVFGSRLPRSMGQGQSLDGAEIALLLENGKSYFWQIKGYISTSHGRESAKGPLVDFLYFSDISSMIELGLSDEDKNRIKEALIEILSKQGGKRAAKSISDYELARVVLDNSIIPIHEIMAILNLIKDDQVKVKTIDLK